MDPLPSLAAIEAIAPFINEAVPPTPQLSWPLLNARTGCERWVKHENHPAIGSFKLRGAINYFARLLARAPGLRGVARHRRSVAA